MELPNGTTISTSGNKLCIQTSQGVTICINTEKQDEICISTPPNQVFVNYNDNCVVTTNRVVKE